MTARFQIGKTYKGTRTEGDGSNYPARIEVFNIREDKTLVFVHLAEDGTRYLYDAPIREGSSEYIECDLEGARGSLMVVAEPPPLKAFRHQATYVLSDDKGRSWPATVQGRRGNRLTLQVGTWSDGLFLNPTVEVDDNLWPTLEYCSWTADRWSRDGKYIPIRYTLRADEEWDE